MIGEVTQNLITKIKTVGAYGTTVSRVGAAAGGKNIDPTMNKVTTPAAWVIFTGDENIDTGDQGSCGPNVRMSFVVKVIIDYTTESDLTNVQYDTLVNTINAVNGQSGPAGTKRWRYEGQTLDELTGNRIVFDQRYSIVAIL